MPNFLLATQDKRAIHLIAVLFVCAYLFPVHDFPYRTFFNELFAIGAALVTLIYLMLLPAAKIRLTSALILPVGLIAIIGLQTLNGLLLYPADSLFPVLTLVGCAAAVIVGATLACQENGLAAIASSLAWAFIISGLISLFCQHVQVLHLDWSPVIQPLKEDGISRPFANLGQPNLLALLLCFALISVWYLYAGKTFKPASAFLLAVLLLWAIALTQSRTAWLILPLFAVLCWKSPAHSRSIPWFVLAGLLLLFILMVFLTPFFLRAAGFIVDSVQHRAGQNSIRLNLWHQAWSFSQLHPWFGSGWGQFGIEEVKYAQFFPPGEYANHAHNIVLNLATEIGWPATIVMSGATLYWCYFSVAQGWSDCKVRFLSLILISVMLHSMVEYPLWFGFYAVPFALIVGALHAGRLGFLDITVPRVATSLFALACLVGGLFICQDVVKISGAFSIAEEHALPISLAEAFPKPGLTTSPQFYDYLYLRDIKIDPQTARENIPVFEKMSLRFGFTPVLESLALLYALDNRPDPAVVALTKIERLHDLNNTSYSNVYKDWETLAANNPDPIENIFSRMPLPGR